MTIPIKTADETLVPWTPDEVWPVLADIGRYPCWWPRSLFVRIRHLDPLLIGTEFSIRPYGWRSFVCQVVSSQRPARICLHYDGHYMGGVAEWRLEAADQGTRVVYAMDAWVNDTLVELAAVVINLQTIHAYSMRGIFHNLTQQMLNRPRLAAAD